MPSLTAAGGNVMATGTQQPPSSHIKSVAPSLDKENVRGSQLKVEPVWHEQVHQSQVSFLAVSEDGDTLFSGCDAAAPKLVEGPDVPAAAVSSKDGTVLQAYAGGKIHSIRLLLSAEPEEMRCINDQGVLVRLTPSDKTVAEAFGAEGGDPTQGSTAPAEPEAEAQLEESGSVGKAGTVAILPASSNGALGPEFLAETGYRGVREGYLFRSGSKGLGYYRKDVVRLYAPMRPRTSAADDTSTAGVDSDAAWDSTDTLSGANPTQGAVAEVAQGEQRQQEQPPAAATKNSQPGSGGSSSSNYLQRLLRAGPSMPSAITSWDGSLMITASLGSKDCCIRVWRLPQPPSEEALPPSAREPSLLAMPTQPTLLHTLSGHTASVLSLALNPEGTLLFSGAHDYTIRVWRTSDWACLRVLKGHGGGVRALAVSPDGATLYSAAGDNTLRAWSTRMWVCLRTLHGRHEETTWPCCMALSSEGELLASGSNGLFGGSTIKVFQTRGWQGREAGTCLATFAQLGFNEKGAVSALAFSRDGRHLYSGASDGTLAAWRLDWVEPIPAGRGTGFRKGFF